MRRIFICAHAKFPRGGAEGNYVQYLALALHSKGYEVYVISRGGNREEDWDKEKKAYIYKDIFYDNSNRQYKGVWDYIYGYFSEGTEVVNKLDVQGFDSQDYIIFYVNNFFYLKEVYDYCKRKKSDASMCITEWYQPFQYEMGVFNPMYWLDYIGFHYGIPMSKKVIPISNYLGSYFRKKDCDTFVLPILADTSEYQWREKESSKKAHFIYSGNSLNKDSIEVILRAFCELSMEEKKSVHLHFTGFSKKTVSALRKKCRNELYQLKDVLQIHDWMRYEELVALYYNIDYLVIARETNKVTKSNFPSKVPEMMAFGIIPVVSRVGDYTEYYLKDGENSIIFDKCDVENCVSAIRKAISLTSDERKRIQANARKTVKLKFDYRNWANEISNWIEKESYLR